MNRRRWTVVLLGCLGPHGGHPPPAPPPRTVEDPVTRQWREAERARAEQDAVLEKVRAVRATKLPAAFAQAEQVLARPRFFRELDDAYYHRLGADPVAAVRELLGGGFGPHDPDPAFARRVELLTATLDPAAGPPDDPGLKDVAARAAALPAESSRQVREVVGDGTWAVARQLLARVRAGRVPLPVAVRFGAAAGDRVGVTFAALAVAADRPAAEVVAYWRESARVRDFRTTGLDFVAGEDLTVAEVEGFVAGLRRAGLVTDDQLRAEYRRQLDRLRGLPGGRGLDDGMLRFTAGLRGTDAALAADLAKLAHGPTRAKTEARLQPRP